MYVWLSFANAAATRYGTCNKVISQVCPQSKRFEVIPAMVLCVPFIFPQGQNIRNVDTIDVEMKTSFLINMDLNVPA